MENNEIILNPEMGIEYYYAVYKNNPTVENLNQFIRTKCINRYEEIQKEVYLEEIRDSKLNMWSRLAKQLKFLKMLQLRQICTESNIFNGHSSHIKKDDLVRFIINRIKETGVIISKDEYLEVRYIKTNGKITYNIAKSKKPF